MIRTVVIENLKIDNKYIRFKKNQYGKPYLKDYTNFNFNISHSGDYVLCVIDNKVIGIDVKEIKHIEYEKIARNCFVTKEFENIINQDLKFQLDRFYKI